jgi:hypothetical protein
MALRRERGEATLLLFVMGAFRGLAESVSFLIHIHSDH